MTTVGPAFEHALAMIVRGDAVLYPIIALSLNVSGLAVVVACVLAFPVGAALAVTRFPGRNVLIVVLNALLGLPAVVAGLAIYLLLSRAGPLGALGILFTPAAMVIAQAVLVFPLIAALTRQAVADAWREYDEQLRSLGAGPLRSTFALLHDLRFSLVTIVLAAFGRAIAEVGAVMIVGGNIDGVTRVMTTAIALETSKGDLPLALGLGFVLLALVFALNVAAHVLKEAAQRRHG
ncbi:MAG TPA: ABC transporter permease [Casimicrobiaceae bacterium]|nr:ABC transporter permease [Casimicrobiaceae bacterium]